MTRKLYYEDAYIKKFSAELISCEPTDGGFDAILDRTAFFPEEGGQSSDTGLIGDATVSYVYEKDGVIHHILDRELCLGTVNCSLNFDDRFDKMQNHTAEHILSGLIHSLYGFDNVGFHIGDGEVTFDVSAPLSEEQLSELERLANEAVYSNLPVETAFPTKDELPSLEYRAKLELTENVRIVKIGDIDSCACCAPHVSTTGQIGLIKILEFMKHRGGVRVWIAAGRRALSDYCEKQTNIKKISAMLSVPRAECASATEKYIKTTEDLKYELKATKEKLAIAFADTVIPTEGNAVYAFEELSKDELCHFVNSALPKIGGILVALSGSDGDYKYLIASSSTDLRPIIKEANLTLSGRGGGKPEAVQGSFAATFEQIKSYFVSQYQPKSNTF